MISNPNMFLQRNSGSATWPNELCDKDVSYLVLYNMSVKLCNHIAAYQYMWKLKLVGKRWHLQGWLAFIKISTHIFTACWITAKWYFFSNMIITSVRIIWISSISRTAWNFVQQYLGNVCITVMCNLIKGLQGNLGKKNIRKSIEQWKRREIKANIELKLL